jgi:DNA polymerase-3 subunit alpha
MCNWFKANYPFEFWITAFEHASEDNIPDYLSEISKLGKIRVSPPEINKSTNHFEYDLELQTLYWDLSKIKGVGEKAVEVILLEREENGQFFSIDEFLYRIENFDWESREGFGVNPVNKKTVENLILAGAFDELHPFEQEFGRYSLICRYYETRKDKIPEIFQANKISKHYWPIQQYEVCKFSSLDYKSLISSCTEFTHCMNTYVTGEQFNLKTKSEDALIIGLIENYEIRQTKKGQSFALVRLLHNSELINIRIWPSELNSDDPRLQIKYYHRASQQEVTGTLENALPIYENKIVAMRGKLELPDQWKSHNELVLSTHLEGELIKFFD